MPFSQPGSPFQLSWERQEREERKDPWVHFSSRARKAKPCPRGARLKDETLKFILVFWLQL